jgi:hypothetical protein
MRPEQAAESQVPAIGLAEEVEHLFLFAGSIAAARGFDLNLATQGDGVNRFVGHRIFDLKLEGEHGDSCEGNDAGGGDLESEIRH